MKNGTGTEALSLDRPAAGKTGTAALRPDTTTSAWFVGYTPQLSAAVDFYKGTGTADLDGVGGLSTFFGGEYPARIWTAFMTAALQGKEVEDVPAAGVRRRDREPAAHLHAVADRADRDAEPRPRRSTPTPLPTTPLPTTPPGPPSTPPGQSSPTDTIIISPPPA